MKIVSTVLLVILLLSAYAVVIYRFEQYKIEQNFLVYSYAECDPSSESCFVADCDPLDDPDCDLTPYKKLSLPAYAAPQCVYEHSCTTFVCKPEKSCETTYCSEDTLDIGEVCSE